MNQSEVSDMGTIRFFFGKGSIHCIQLWCLRAIALGSVNSEYIIFDTSKEFGIVVSRLKNIVKL